MLGDKEIFSRNIKEQMYIHNQKLGDIVAGTGLKYNTVRDWITGRTYPSIDKIQILAEYFGVSKGDLTDVRINNNSEVANDYELVELCKLVRSRPTVRKLMNELVKEEDDVSESIIDLIRTMRGKT